MRVWAALVSATLLFTGIGSADTADTPGPLDGLVGVTDPQVEELDGAEELPTVTPETDDEEPPVDQEDEAGEAPPVEGEEETVEEAVTPALDTLIKVGKFSPKAVPSGTTRLSGADRYQTSVAISQRITANKRSVSAVFIASGSSYADGLALGALAAYVGGPLLLTHPKTLSPQVRDEIKALRPETIYIAGGTGAVSAAVEKSLEATGSNIVRLSGKNRYETASVIAGQFPEGTPVFLTTGLNFPDALSAGAAAAKISGAIILTDGWRLTGPSKTALEDLAPTKVYAVGGKWSTTETDKIQTATNGAVFQVLSGADRYATSAKVASTFWTAPKTLMYATGRNFADALAGGPAAKALDAPIVLTPGGCRPTALKNIAAGQKAVVQLGGMAVVGEGAHSSECRNNVKGKAAFSFSGGTYQFNTEWQGQERNYWCGSASAYMILNRLGWKTSASGVTLNQTALASTSHNYVRTDEWGESPWRLNRVGTGMNNWMNSTLYKKYPNPTTDQLRSLVKASFLTTGRPVAIHIQNGPHLPGMNNQPPRDYTHVMVIDGYDSIRDEVIILDPGAITVWPTASPQFRIKIDQLPKYLTTQGAYY